MGIIEKFRKEVAAAPAAATADNTDGRDRLRQIAGELADAQKVVADADALLDRLIRVIRDADAAEEALQASVAEDGGVSLAAYSAGEAADAPIAKLISTKKITAEAAAVAKAALSGVQSKLEAARTEVTRLEGVRFDATIVYLKTRAEDKHRSYHDAFAVLSNLYDQLCGVAVAVSATGHADMMTSGLPLPIQAPGFNLSTGPSHGPSETVTLAHTPGAGEARVAQSTSRWLEARERLLQNPDADVDDLIGPQAEKGKPK
jgi:hypothetical protein